MPKSPISSDRGSPWWCETPQAHFDEHGEKAVLRAHDGTPVVAINLELAGPLDVTRPCTTIDHLLTRFVEWHFNWGDPHLSENSFEWPTDHPKEMSEIDAAIRAVEARIAWIRSLRGAPPKYEDAANAGIVAQQAANLLTGWSVITGISPMPQDQA